MALRDKLHLIYNEKAELFNSIIILEDVNDQNLLEYKPIAEFIYGKPIVDNGNVNKNISKRLFVGGIRRNL